MNTTSKTASNEPSLSGFSNSQLRKLHGSGEYQKRLNGFNSTVDKNLINKQLKELDAKERYRLKMKSMRNNRYGGYATEDIKEEVKTKIEQSKEEKSTVTTKNKIKSTLIKCVSLTRSMELLHWKTIPL